MKNLIAFLFLISFSSLSAQSILHCGDQLKKLHLEKKYPGISDVIESTFKSAKTNYTERAAVLRIPVVFHVLYNKDEENLSDEIIHSQMEVLNEDFRRLNANASETRGMFQNIAADPEIEFFLAGQDPQGNPSTGITRTFTEEESFISFSLDDILEAFVECGFNIEDPVVAACIDEFFASLEEFDLDVMKSPDTGGVSPWDTERYLNIWVANLSIDSGGEQVPFILGFAYPPMEAPNWPEETLPEDLEAKDGVVLHYQAVGRYNPVAGSLNGSNDEGRTAVHEVGHYLGLRHIWGDGECSMDDGISDTPAAASNSQPTVDISNCDEMHNKDTCFDDMSPDMIENYMDYSLERCQNMFTTEQVSLMRAMLEGPRSGLLNNQISAVENLTSEKPSIFPNPSSGQINVKGWTKEMIVKVYDLSGAMVMTSTQANFILDQSQGLYLIEIINADQRTFEKLVVK